MKFLLVIVAVGCFLVPFSEAVRGWDGIQAVTVGGFQCLKDANYNFFIGRVWKSIGNFDETGIANIKNARKAGWDKVDGYLFPCLKPSCSTAKNQVEAVIVKLNAEGAKINKLWLDIEQLEWPANTANNRQFILDMISQAEAMSVPVG